MQAVPATVGGGELSPLTRQGLPPRVQKTAVAMLVMNGVPVVRELTGKVVITVMATSFSHVVEQASQEWGTGGKGGWC